MTPAPIGWPGPLPEVDAWPVVELDGVRWHVAPVYLGPASRADALVLATLHGCDLPSPELVDAIWTAADLRLDSRALARVPSAVHAAERHAAHVGARVCGYIDLAGNVSFRLLAGSHKDWARRGARVDLYGWHDLEGRPVQPWGTSHSSTYVDYSQGVRLVRRCP